MEETNGMEQMEETNGMEEHGDNQVFDEMPVEASDSLNSNSEAIDEGGQQAIKTSQEQEYDWTKDERYKKMWKEDPNQVYKSYRHAEGRLEELKPYQSRFDELSKKFEERGMSLEQVDDFINEYTSFKDPENPRNQDLAILESFMANPENEQRIGNFFRELQVEEMQRQFPGMNEKQIQEHIQLKQRVDAFERAEKQREEAEQKRQYEAKTKEFIQEIQIKNEEIEKFAKEKGFEVNEEVRRNFLEYCVNNNIPISAMKGVFIEQNMDKLQEAWENKLRDNIKNGKSKTDKINVPSATRGNASTGQKTGLSKLEEIIQRSFK